MANRVKALLNKMFNWGVQNEIVSVNPAYLVPTPGKEHQRDQVLSEDEIKHLWSALDQLRNGEQRTRKYRILTGTNCKAWSGPNWIAKRAGGQSQALKQRTD
jgi:site-specific recombinase XerD